MHPMAVVVLFEILKFPFQVINVPEKRMVEKIATYGSDQPFDKGMR